MSKQKRCVYYFGMNLETDPAAKHIFEAVEKTGKDLTTTNQMIDEWPVLEYKDEQDNIIHFVRTQRVIWHDLDCYLPIMKEHFEGYDFGGLITWHEGDNAPDKIFSIHSAGDPLSGNFGPANAEYMRNLMLSMEKNRVALGMDDYTVTTEATHWSSIVYSNAAAERVLEYNVPIVDIEIGSSPEAWANPDAAKVIANALFDVFNSDGKNIVHLLCAGGIHFEPSFAGAVFESWDNNAFGVSHILANQWLVGGAYEEESGLEKIENCIASIVGGIGGIAIHDKMKGTYKEQFRILGAKYNVPVFKHQQLKRPKDIAWKKQP